MTRAWIAAIGVATALGIAGVLAAGSYGGASSAAQQGATTLVSQGCDGGACESFPLDSAEAGSIVATNVKLADVSGKPVGRARCWCTVVRGVGWPCNMILTLAAGKGTKRGIITATGLNWPLSDKGEVNTYAITGGAGAYVGATGYATNGWDPKRKAFVLDLHLTQS
ncbi:MAG TPA: hypothetical protein VFU99_10175 [Gaiellaceae bacterium]|nr:hypothetical protein [Gaiellaceae bacterium]